MTEDRDSQPDWGHPPTPTCYPGTGCDQNDCDTNPHCHTGPHTCDNGWINRDTAQPCLTCKPWLAHPTAPGAQPRKAT